MVPPKQPAENEESDKRAPVRVQIPSELGGLHLYCPLDIMLVQPLRREHRIKHLSRFERCSNQFDETSNGILRGGGGGGSRGEEGAEAAAEGVQGQLLRCILRCWQQGRLLPCVL